MVWILYVKVQYLMLLRYSQTYVGLMQINGRVKISNMLGIK